MPQGSLTPPRTPPRNPPDQPPAVPRATPARHGAGGAGTSYPAPASHPPPGGPRRAGGGAEGGEVGGRSCDARDRPDTSGRSRRSASLPHGPRVTSDVGRRIDPPRAGPSLARRLAPETGWGTGRQAPIQVGAAAGKRAGSPRPRPEPGPSFATLGAQSGFRRRGSAVRQVAPPRRAHGAFAQDHPANDPGRPCPEQGPCETLGRRASVTPHRLAHQYS